MKIDPNAPAFPGGDGPYAGNPTYYAPGMSIRCAIAARMPDPPHEWLENMMNTNLPLRCGGLEIAQNIAVWKRMCADALIEELNKEAK